VAHLHTWKYIVCGTLSNIEINFLLPTQQHGKSTFFVSLHNVEIYRPWLTQLPGNLSFVALSKTQNSIKWKKLSYAAHSTTRKSIFIGSFNNMEIYLLWLENV
jgi:hypothetical protein